MKGYLGGMHDTPTEPRIAVRDVETVVQIENLWAHVLGDIEKVHALEDGTPNVSLKAALAQAGDALYAVAAHLNRASAIARRDGR